MTTFVVTNSVFRGFFEKQKLDGPNFIDWYRQLRIVLSIEDKLDYLEQPIPPAPIRAQAGQQVTLEALAAHAAWKAYQGFLQTVQNFSMYDMRKTINELHTMLKLHEQTHPKQNAPVLHNLAELLKNMKLSQGASGSGIFTIKLYTFPNKSWVYDTGCDTHIGNTTQGLRRSRKLKPGALSLYVGNDVPLRPLNPQPLQSHLFLDITLSLSPITPLDHIHETPSPPSPP
nr:hypothetical protein [Tanacetum cinerariifolium]